MIMRCVTGALAAAVALAGCATSSSTGLSPRARRDLASQAAYAKAHPAAIEWEADRDIWLHLWTVAASLQPAIMDRVAAGLRKVGYLGPASDMANLASLPVTGDTAAQMSDATADVTALDAFFRTPGVTP
jgi:hypothetical protein